MKNKTKISFVCQECGYDTPSWLGKCPECGTWNSLKEIRIVPLPVNPQNTFGKQAMVFPQRLTEVKVQNAQRQSTGFSEMDTVLGGGIVHGSVSLLAGDPGVGKSTLLLELCYNIAKNDTVLYVSGEESIDQIKLRADRLFTVTKNTDKTRTTNMSNIMLLSLNDVDVIVAQIAESGQKPALVIIDSIQTMQSANVAGLSGAVSQVRYAASRLINVAKTLNIPIIIVGHVTKEGMVAGPMVLSHMVDTVLFLEGEKFVATRILRSLKNRFGPVDEVGIFLMQEEGMKEVTNPEQMFLTKQNQETPGSVLVATMEGTRAFLIELQALVVYSKLPMPRRVVSGIDSRRLELLLAVLQKHCRLPLETMDVFVNVAGGLKLTDPGIDVGICLAVYSSLRNIPLPKTVGCAEVGLLGELRVVAGLEKRIREAKQLGFTNIITAKTQKTLNEALKMFENKVKS